MICNNNVQIFGKSTRLNGIKGLEKDKLTSFSAWQSLSNIERLNGQPMNDVCGENRVFMDGDEVIYEIGFPRMDNTSSLSLVPVYARTGAHEDEAITLETSEK